MKDIFIQERIKKFDTEKHPLSTPVLIKDQEKHMEKPFKLIDLTHSLSPHIPTWGGKCGFKHSLQSDYEPHAEYQFRTHKVHMDEGIGTHMDAPAHCIPGGQCIDEFDLNDLSAPCCVLDISSQAHERYSLMVQDIEAFEARYGHLPPGCFVIVYTGWERYWRTPEKYRNNLVFPSVSAEAALALLERHIVGLGIDTLSPDRSEDGFPVHQRILGAGKFIVENVANASLLPPVGAYSLAFPMKIQGGTEAHVRLVGVIIK